MNSLRRGWCAAFLSLGLVLGLLVGCGNPTIPLPKNGEDTAKLTDDSLQDAREVVRLASEPAAYQKALEVFNSQLDAQPAKLDDAAHERKLLVERIGLDEEELREVEATRFSPLDAHYLDFCFQLRDAARSLRQNERGQARLEQIKRAFDWVMRQVALEVRSSELEAPEFVLRRGFGGPRERALIFLALLRQMNLEGCIIAYPGKDGPVYWLAGALLKDKETHIYLFDPRLGLPLPGPKGGIATLAQLRKQPELLKQLNLGGDYDYDVKPEQAQKAEVYLALPLSALSARMRYLEDKVFATQDRVKLALRPSQVLAQFDAAGVGPVHIWNERGKPGSPAPMTPTRVLRKSLPPQEGGVDARGEHYRHYHERRIPWLPILKSFHELGIANDLPIAMPLLRGLVRELFGTYILASQQQIIRGRFDETAKRMVRIEQVLREYEDAQPNEMKLKQMLTEWYERIKRAFNEGGQQKALESMMAEDPFYQAVRNPEGSLFQEMQDPDDRQNQKQRLRKGMLGTLIFRAAGESLQKEVLYLQALRWQEAAERQQARLGRKGAKGHVAEAAADAWNNAHIAWTRYQRSNPITAEGVDGRVGEFLAIRQTGNLEMVTYSLDRLLRDPCRALAAQALHARALLAAGKNQEVVTVLERLQKDADTVLKSRALQKLRRDMLKVTPTNQQIIDTQVFGDLRPTGAIHWIAYQARLELRKLSAK